MKQTRHLLPGLSYNDITCLLAMMLWYTDHHIGQKTTDLARSKSAEHKIKGYVEAMYEIDALTDVTSMLLTWLQKVHQTKKVTEEFRTAEEFVLQLEPAMHKVISECLSSPYMRPEVSDGYWSALARGGDERDIKKAQEALRRLKDGLHAQKTVQVEVEDRRQQTITEPEREVHITMPMPKGAQ